MESVTFECNSILKATWRFKNQILLDSYKYKYSNKCLTVRDVKKDDKGYYECIGISSFQQQFVAQAMLIVNTTEKLDDRVYPNIVHANLYDEVSFVCTSSTPVQWTFLHGPLPPDSIQLYDNMTYTGILKVKLSKYENFGVYICEGESHDIFATFYNFATIQPLRK